MPRRWGILPDGRREFLTRTEARHLARLDLDLLACLRVAADASLALGHRERAESDQGDAVSFLQRLGDAVDQRIQRLAGSSLADLSVFGDLVDQIRLVHATPPRDEIVLVKRPLTDLRDVRALYQTDRILVKTCGTRRSGLRSPRRIVPPRFEETRSTR